MFCQNTEDHPSCRQAPRLPHQGPPEQAHRFCQGRRQGGRWVSAPFAFYLLFLYSHVAESCDMVIGHREDNTLTFFDYSLAPYEKRVIELLRNSKDKRARKLAKKRVGPPLRQFASSCPNRSHKVYANSISSSEPSAVPRRRSMSSKASSLSPAVPATKRTSSN